MNNGAGFAMGRSLCPGCAAAEKLVDALQAQTDTKDGKMPVTGVYDLHAGPGLIRIFGAWTDDYSRRGKVQNLRWTHSIVTAHDHLAIKHAQELDQIEGKGIVVVHHENLHI
jgi:hypothetical protein